jgi:hypothetical protein
VIVKRISIVGGVSIVALALALSVGVAEPASAACYRVDEAGTGKYETIECNATKPGTEFTLAELLVRIEPGLWCAKSTVPETGRYLTLIECETGVGAGPKGLYIRVKEVPESESTKLLPEPTTANPITDEIVQSEAGHLLSNSGLEVKCKETAGSETWTSANLTSSTAHLLMSHCTSSLESVCTGEGEPAGLIAMLGTVHFWLGLLMTGTKAKPGSELVSALVFLTNEVKYKCENKSGTFKVAVVVKPGCTAAQDLPASLNKLVSEVKEESAEWAPTETKGESGILSVLPQGGTTEIACLQHLTVNGGAEQLAAITAKYAVKNYKHNEGALTIELMK